MSRIGIRVLAGFYRSLRTQQSWTLNTMMMNGGDDHPTRNYIRMICSHTSPYKIVQQADNDATKMCYRKFNVAPEVIIQGRLNLTFSYISTHLHYILLELLKNIMRAAV